jgi:hypothetical protein
MNTEVHVPFFLLYQMMTGALLNLTLAFYYCAGTKAYFAYRYISWAVIIQAS